jgi:hypothetical protein
VAWESEASSRPTQIHHHLRRGRAIVLGDNYLRHEHVRVSGCGASVGVTSSAMESTAGGTSIPGSEAAVIRHFQERMLGRIGLSLLVSAPFYKPHSPATSFDTGVIPPLADWLLSAR